MFLSWTYVHTVLLGLRVAILAMDAAFRDAGINIAYPQRDVHLAGTLAVTPGGGGAFGSLMVTNFS